MSYYLDIQGVWHPCPSFCFLLISFKRESFLAFATHCPALLKQFITRFWAILPLSGELRVLQRFQLKSGSFASSRHQRENMYLSMCVYTHHQSYQWITCILVRKSLLFVFWILPPYEMTSIHFKYLDSQNINVAGCLNIILSNELVSK